VAGLLRFTVSITSPSGCAIPCIGVSGDTLPAALPAAMLASLTTCTAAFTCGVALDVPSMKIAVVPCAVSLTWVGLTPCSCQVSSVDP